MINFVLYFFTWFLFGWLTHYLMYLKCKASVQFKIKYNFSGKYDILNKDEVDPRSNYFHGIVIISNGVLSFILYIIFQLYWTGWKYIEYLYDRYHLELTWVKPKHYTLKLYACWIISNNTKINFSSVLQDKQLRPFCDTYSNKINWNSLIEMDNDGQLYWQRIKVSPSEMAVKIKQFIDHYNSYKIITDITDL